MKATAQALRQEAISEKSRAAVYADLFKARLTLLVMLTTLVGFYMGSRGPVDYAVLFHAMMGMALVASGGAALNQLLEREHDARMERTRERPLPSGRLLPRSVLRTGSVCSAAGIAWLWLGVNAITAVLALFTLICYLFVYTPLKRLTWTNTLFGAIPGAMPPLIGWTSARGELGTEGWVLFALQALWQIPHFMAIAWIYADEYSKAGFRMLPAFDKKGTRTAWLALGFCLLLLGISVLPFALGQAGWLYLLVALLCGGAFTGFAIKFLRSRTLPRARWLFLLSIVYLPVVLSVMVFDKVN
jgi:protoheme IX farnesyltransferase